MATLRVSNATTPKEVYQALKLDIQQVSYITVKGKQEELGGMIPVGGYAEGVKAYVGNREPFERSNGKMATPCRTNKWRVEGQDAIVQFGILYKTKKWTLEQAVENAYLLMDEFNIELTVWEDQVGASALLAGRMFSGTVGDVITFERTDKKTDVKFTAHKCEFKDVLLTIQVAANIKAVFEDDDDVMEDEEEEEETPASRVVRLKAELADKKKSAATKM